ncbi:MAG: hypothetical protein ACI9WU_005055 [Myxococcota bacterium]
MTDPDSLLHIRSFLDHDRPYVPPVDRAAAAARQTELSDGVYVAPDGSAIAPGTVLQSLIEYLRGWRAVVGRHGLWVLEVHSLTAATVRQFRDESESLHFDTYHALSGQQLVSADQWLLASAEAGLLPRPGESARYPAVLPFTRITLNQLEAPGFSVRHPGPDDISGLVELERQSWQRPALQTRTAELTRRVLEQPGEQYVAEIRGRVVGALYSQRVATLADVSGHGWDDRHLAADTAGAVVQLLGLNVAPEGDHVGVGHGLLSFVLQRSAVRAGVTTVAGVSRFRDLPSCGLSAEGYLTARDAQGLHPDPILRFHQDHGARIEGLVPGHRPADRDNGGAGVLVVYGLAPRAESASQPLSEVVSQSPDDSLLAVFEHCLQAITGQSHDLGLALQLSWAESGLDSMDLLEFSALLTQRLGRRITPVFFVQHPTPARAVDHLLGASVGSRG